MLIKTLLGLVSRPGERARLSSLIFHRVLPAQDALFPEEMHAERFDALCGWLRQWFNVLPLHEAARRLQTGDLPGRALTITFDDGYADNHSVAAPILAEHGLPCTFFVSTGYLDGGRMWNDTVIETIRRCRLTTLDLADLHEGLGQVRLDDAASRRSAIDAIIAGIKYLPASDRQRLVDVLASRAQVTLPTDLMMRSEQVRDLRATGFQIGAHTVTHPILAALPGELAFQEIVDSKRYLENLLGESVPLFAYPNGKPGADYSPQTVDLVREAGFECAVSTAWGVSTRATDPFQLRRFTPWDRSRTRFGLRMAANAAAGTNP